MLRSLVLADQAVPLPSEAKKPSGWGLDWTSFDRFARWRERGRHFPPVEQRRRRAGIERHGLRRMLVPVHQHVDDSIPDLARRLQRARVIALAPHIAVPLEDAVH